MRKSGFVWRRGAKTRRDTCRRWLAARLDNDVSTHFFIAAVQIQRGNFSEALASLDRATPSPRWLDVESLRSYIHAVTGNEEEARNGLAELERLRATERISPWFAAIVHLGPGDVGLAVDRLEEAYALNTRQMRLLPMDPVFAGLRGQHERFDALVARVLGQVPPTAAAETP